MKKSVFTSIFASAALFAQAQTAQVQIIHNCADAAASMVGVWVNNTEVADSVMFRTATGFASLTAGTPIDISITAPNSPDTVGAVARFTVTLTPNESYIVVADGIVSSTGYNPSNQVAPFDLKIYSGARQTAQMMTNTDVLVHHGCTDAPTVDVRTIGNAVLVDDASYGDFAGYLALPNADYVINVTDATGSTVVASYQAPLSTLSLGNQAITVLASGFLNPANNSNGPAFGLWVALPAGGALVQLPLAVSVNKIEQVENISMFPNPAQDVLNLGFNAVENTDLNIQITDAVGRLVQQQQLANVSGQQNLQISTQNLPNGAYQVTLRSNKGLTTQKLLIQK